MVETNARKIIRRLKRGRYHRRTEAQGAVRRGRGGHR